MSTGMERSAKKQSPSDQSLLLQGQGMLGRLAAWHLPNGPVGPASRWAATSHV